MSKKDFQWIVEPIYPNTNDVRLGQMSEGVPDMNIRSIQHLVDTLRVFESEICEARKFL